jgi:pyruvate kinase
MAAGEFHWVEDGDLSGVPDGSIIGVRAAFDGSFTGNPGKIAGIIDAHHEASGNVPAVARELETPMISRADITGELADGDTVTLDAERGIIYRGAARGETHDASE